MTKKMLFAVLTAMIIISQAVAGDYDFGIASLEKHASETPEDLRPGNEPFFYAGDEGEIAVLLIHGFTASPWEVKGLGKYLASKNMTVYCPLLPGHGTKAEDLRNTKWEDWYAVADKSYLLLRETSDCVCVGGMSTGSSLALMVAEQHDDVCCIISVGTPVYFQDWRIIFSGFLKYIIPYTRKYVDPEKASYYYDRRPTAAVAELYEMVGMMRLRLPRIKQPIIIIQSLEDETVKPESAQYIFDNVGSGRKKVFVWLEKGEHVLFTDKQKNEIFDLVDKFIEEDVR